MKALFNIEKLAIRILYILIAFLFSMLFAIPISAHTINYEHEYHSCSSVDIRIAEEINSPMSQNLKDAENVLRLTCKSEGDLLDYRN